MHVDANRRTWRDTLARGGVLWATRPPPRRVRRGPDLSQRPLEHLPCLRDDAQLAFLLVHVDATVLRGWSPLRLLTALRVGGLIFTTTLSGGQPLHPICSSRLIRDREGELVEGEFCDRGPLKTHGV